MELRTARSERARVRLKSFAAMKGMDRMAIHEAGHAVINHVLGAHVNAVTIAYHSPNACPARGRAEDGNAGFCAVSLSTIQKDRRVQSFIISGWAGYEAEILFGVDIGFMSRTDFYDICALFVRECELRNANEEEQAAIRNRTFGAMRIQARRMVVDHANQILDVHSELRVKRWLSRDQFLAIVEREKLP